MKNENYKELRREHNARKRTGYYAEKLGTKCFNCGSEEGIVYHHIVPLAVCGTNRLSNIVPVCQRCHKSIHGTKSHEEYEYTENVGRHSTAAEDTWDEVLSEYALCRISNKEASKRVNRKYGAHLSNSPFYKRFLKAHGIKKIRNNLDIIATNGKGIPNKGAIVGYIELEQGNIIEMVW